MKTLSKKNKHSKYHRIALAFICVFTSLEVAAFPIAAPGTEGLGVIVSSTNNVIATYQGNSAAYSNDLYLEGSGLGIIFNNHSSSVGSTFDLGSFSIGTELIFRLHVNNTGYDFFTGSAARNPDQNFHARVQENWMTNETLVSFEDLFNGPFNYNDLSFSFTNVATSIPPITPQVPIPAAAFMFAPALLGLIGLRRKAKQYSRLIQE